MKDLTMGVYAKGVKMNMSFMLTTDQIRNRTKTVTRRVGWKNLKSGKIINACEKCQGLKKGQSVKVLCQIRVIDVRREPLSEITKNDVIKEGFPEMTVNDFVNMFTTHMKCKSSSMVTRIEFEYLS